MPRSRRALLLDLDDTLYPLVQFRISGFAAVARDVSRKHGLDEQLVFRQLVSASRGAQRGRELDLLISRFGLNRSVADLICVVRRHEPVLRLPWTTAVALRRLRRSWSLAIVTNGIPSIQAAKVRALELERMVDTVVYASDHGLGEGKPEREPFLEALRRLDVPPSRSVAVGDDGFADVFGAMRCGLRSILTREWRDRPGGPLSVCADAVVSRLSEVPPVAESLLPRKLVRRAA